MEGLLFFYLREENRTDKFVSLEQNTFEEDFELSFKNTRYYSTSLLYILCQKFHRIFLDIFIPLIWRNCFLSHVWDKVEAGIFLFSKLHLFVSDNTITHFQPIIARLLDLMNHPDLEIKFPAVVTLKTYTRHCVHLQPSHFFCLIWRIFSHLFMIQINLCKNKGV